MHKTGQMFMDPRRFQTRNDLASTPGYMKKAEGIALSPCFRSVDKNHRTR